MLLTSSRLCIIKVERNFHTTCDSSRSNYYKSHEETWEFKKKRQIEVNRYITNCTARSLGLQFVSSIYKIRSLGWQYIRLIYNIRSLGLQFVSSIYQIYSFRPSNCHLLPRSHNSFSRIAVCEWKERYVNREKKCNQMERVNRGNELQSKGRNRTHSLRNDLLLIF